MSMESSRTSSAGGKLYLVATPIGNLEDVTLRALRLLKEVDLIACEDTRHTAKLLNHFGIATQCESHHEHNEVRHTQRLIALLRDGKNVALVSDAGTPLLSDPGYSLVAAAREAGIEVVPVPGPCAAIMGLTASGLPTDSFYFAGFLPPKPGARRKRLQEISAIPGTMIFYEAPHRVLAALEDMIAILGDRRACLAREITKIHEEWVQGTLSIIRDAMRDRPQVRGEITLIVDRHAPPAHEERSSLPASIAEHLQAEMEKTGASKKDALKAVARQRGISRKDAYRQCLLEKG
jgi:16S rRNA (cytidine1402-2'-O)-methyltransferase